MDMSQKNLNADLTNPNLYHNIDENAEEHVYDEIKLKEGCKDPGKYSFIAELSMTSLTCNFSIDY